MFVLQGNTVIASEASSRMEAFTDVEVNLSGDAARTADPAAASPLANGHAPEASPSYSVHVYSDIHCMLTSWRPCAARKAC